MRITYMLIIFFSLFINSCASGPTPEQRARWAKNNAIQKKNTEDFVEIFMTEIWNKPPNEIGGKIQGLKAETEPQFRRITRVSKLKGTLENERLQFIKNKKTGFLSASYDVCNNLSRPAPLSVGVNIEPARNKKTTKVEWYSTSFKLGYAFKFLEPKNKKGKLKQCTRPSGPKQMYGFGGNTGLVTRIHDAWAIQKKLVANGVPLVFCYQPKDPNKRFAKKTHFKYTVVKCSIDIGSYLGRRGNYILHGSPSIAISTHNYGYMAAFQIKNLRLKKEDLTKSLSEIYQKRFQDPDYVKRVGSYFYRLKGQSESAYQAKMAKYNAIEAEERAYQRKLDKSQAAMIHSSLSEGINKIRNSKVGLASPQVQAIGNRKNYITKSSPANAYIPKGQPKPHELQNNFQNWCSKGGGSFNSSTGKCSHRKGVAKADPYLADRAACLKQDRKWLGDRCDSVTNKITFPGRNKTMPSNSGALGAVGKATSNSSGSKLQNKKCYPLFKEFVADKYDPVTKKTVKDVEAQAKADARYESAFAQLTPACQQKTIEFQKCKKDPKCRSRAGTGKGTEK